MEGYTGKLLSIDLPICPLNPPILTTALIPQLLLSDPHSLIMKEDFCHCSTLRQTEGDLPATGAEALELTSLHPDPSPLTLTWFSLFSLARKSRALSEISLPCEKLPERSKCLLIAAVAIQVENWSLLKEAKLALYSKEKAENVTNTELLFSALESCISCDLEEIASHIVETIGSDVPFPVYLVHRAGERGMLRFLKCICDYKVALHGLQALRKAVWRLKLHIKRPANGRSQRFQSNCDYLTAEDVLTWAVIAGGETKVRQVLNWGISISNLNLGKFLLKEGLLSLFDSLIKALRIPLTPSLTAHLLTYKEYDRLRYYIEVSLIQREQSWFVCRTSCLLCASEVMEQLICMLDASDCMLPGLYFLSLVQESDFSLSYIKCIFAKMVGFRGNRDLEGHLFVNHQNPLLLCVVISETCARLSSFRLIYREKFLLLSHFFLQFCQNILSQYQDFRHIKAAFLTKSYGNKCLLDLLSSNTERYSALLSSSAVVALAQDLWTGGEEFMLNFSAICGLTHVFTDLDVFSLHKRRKPTAKCVLRLQSWRKAASLRAIVEGVGLICLYGLGLFAVIVYVRSMEIIRNSHSDIEETQQANTEVVKAVDLIGAYLFIAVSLVLHQLQRIAYKQLLKEPMKWAAKDCVDILLLLATVLIQAVYRTLPSNKDTFQLLIDLMESCFTVVFILAGIRMGLSCAVYQTVGPLLRMVIIVMKDVIAFVMLYAVCLITCATVFNILFYTSPPFNTLALSLRTLFQWSVGGPDLSLFEGRETLGSLLGVLWMFISSIVLLNLLIAVLSTRYSQVWPQCMADYVSALYNNYTQVRYEKPYGALVVSPAPFSVLTSPLLILYWLYPKSAKYMDYWFVLIAYQPIFVCGVGVFTGYTLICALVAYISVFVRLIGSCRVRKGLMWLFLGPFYLLYVSGSTIYSFCSLLYSDIDEESSQSNAQFAISSISSFLQSACKGKQTACTVSLSDIASVVAPFPRNFLPNSLPIKRFPSLVAAAAKEKGKVSYEVRAEIVEIFKPFQSYSETLKEGKVDLLRMLRFLPVFPHFPSMNVAYTQQALRFTT